MAQMARAAVDRSFAPTTCMSSAPTASPSRIDRMASCSFIPDAFTLPATSTLLASITDCGAWAYSQ